MKQYVTSLIKFLEKIEYANSFFDGNLFCQPWNYYRILENQEQGDYLETISAKKRIEILIGRQRIYTDLLMQNTDDVFTPVFCMYSIFSEFGMPQRKIQLHDERLKDFGNYAVVIHNVDQFIDYINILTPLFSRGLVDYIDKENPKGVNKFAYLNPILQKDLNKYSHQNEFRIYNQNLSICTLTEFDKTIPFKTRIEPSVNGGAIFKIPSLVDIAEIYTLDQLFSGIVVNPKIKYWNKISTEELTKAYWWDGNKNNEIDLPKIKSRYSGKS
jgi:hypothetical protein